MEIYSPFKKVVKNDRKFVLEIAPKSTQIVNFLSEKENSVSNINSLVILAIYGEAMEVRVMEGGGHLTSEV